MHAFVTTGELIVLWALLAVPTGIAFIWSRRKKEGAQVGMRGSLLLLIVATCLGAFVISCDFVDTWRRTRPERMLVTFLKVEDVSKFTDLRSDFNGGLDYTAWIYFQTSPERLRRLIQESNFEMRPPGESNQAYMARFSKAPELPSSSNAVIYFRVSPENHDLQYLVTESTHTRAWFVSLDH